MASSGTAPLFGKAWAREAGVDLNQKPEGIKMVISMGLITLGVVLMAWVLAHIVEIWHPSSWGVGLDESPAKYGSAAGLFMWLGFVVPLLFNAIGFEGKSWTLFAINTGYYFVALQFMGLTLAYL